MVGSAEIKAAEDMNPSSKTYIRTIGRKRPSRDFNHPSHIDTKLKIELEPTLFIEPETGDQIEMPSRGDASPPAKQCSTRLHIHYSPRRHFFLINKCNTHN